MNPTLRKRAIFLSIALLVLFIISGVFLIYRFRDVSKPYTAYIYQNGILTETIDLSMVTSSYTLIYRTNDGGENHILVEPGSIAVVSANCPDKVCVHQGTIRNSLLPITCLPHGLVIELKANLDNIDTITY